MKQTHARWFYLGIAATACSSLVYEIVLTRIFSVLLWYHFAYLAISVALFGLGAGGLAAFLFDRRLARHREGALAGAALAQFSAITLGLLFILNVPLRVGLSPSGIAGLAMIWLTCSVPFVMTGMILALAFRYHTARTPRIYFTDLLGSALGCLVFVVAISHVSGPSVALLSAYIAAVAAGAFVCARRSRHRYHSKTILAAVAVVLSVPVLIMVGRRTRLLSVKYTKNYVDRDDRLFEKWSPLARITVYPGVFWAEDARRPFGWGMSKAYTPTASIDQLWVEQDACAGTPITRFDGDFSKLDYLRHDVTSLPYHVKENADVFIVGAGGGRDVLTALAFNSRSVLACDINPVIVDLVKNRYRDFAGGLYSLPRVRVEVAEARSFIRTQEERFDVIQISLIDTWASTASGALSLSENSLYTVEAFADYFKHLRDDGMLSVTRYLFMPRNQSLRVAIVARRALETLGVTNPGRHIVVAGNDDRDGVATVLAKRTPFRREELDRIRRTIKACRFVPLYLAGSEAADPAFAAALETRPLQAFLDQSYYDVRPTTDDRPFFFQMTYFSDVLDLLTRHGEIKGQTFNFLAQVVLLALLILATLLVGIFYALPLVMARRSFNRDGSARLHANPPPGLWGIYFVLLGLGFMLVEIPLVQKGALYLGHPTYGLTVILTSMLAFAGIGSMASARISTDLLARRLGRYLLAVACVIGMTTLCIDEIVPFSIGWPFAARAAVVVGLAGFQASFMGVAFPSGIRMVSRRHPESIPWAWALNGGASVLGSIIAMALAMNIGFRATLFAGVLVYLGAACVAGLASRSSKRETGMAAKMPAAISAETRYPALPQKTAQ